MTRSDDPPRPDAPRNRAVLLTDAGRVVAALLLGGSAPAVAQSPLTRAAGPGGDLATLRLLAAGERLAVELYERASALPGLDPDAGVWVEGALRNERDHLEALADAAASSIAAGVDLAPDPRLASWPGLLEVAHSLETALTGAYLGATGYFSSPDLRAMAAAIGANEAQHLDAVARLRSGRRANDPPALAGADPAAAARSALARHAARPLPA